MRARFRSYGETSTLTRSPGRMRMRKRRILPATWPRTSWPLSSCTRNIAFGSASTTSPSNSTFSSFAKRLRPSDRSHVRGLRPLRALAELVLDLRALRERAEAVALDRREVDERVLAPVIRRDEPEALLVAEPLHDTRWHLLQHLRCVSSRCGGVLPALPPDAPVYTSAPGVRLAGRRAGVGRRLRRRLVLVGVELRPAGV